MKLVLAFAIAATAHAQYCSQDRCRSPDGQGGTDCWDGNWDGISMNGWFPCSEGQARVTGKTTRSGGKTWQEYTCCDAVCDRGRCRDIGNDCISNTAEGFKCSSGQAQLTGQGGGLLWHYTCCDSNCDDGRCTSPDGKGGKDCWGVLPGEGYPCSGDYIPVLRGPTSTQWFVTYHKYSCCRNPDPPENQKKGGNQTSAEEDDGAVGAIIGIVVGVLVFVALIVGLVVVIRKKKNQAAAPPVIDQQQAPSHRSEPAVAAGTPVATKAVTIEMPKVASGVKSLAQKLEEFGCGQYEAALADQGYDSMDSLQGLTKEEAGEIADDAKMKPGHKRRFVDGFGN